MKEQKGKRGRFGFPCIGGVICLWLVVLCGMAVAGEVSIAVKENVNTLIQTKSCPGCDLSGADLTRLDLSGADLEGADLSDAKVFLADLTNVNLKNAKLRGAGFGGTDMAGADLRGADLRGVDLSGAYLEGVKMDGEFITTTPFEKEGLTDIKKEVYVDDTVKPKEAPLSKDVKISKRRDFQETPPAAKAEIVKKEVQKSVPPPAPQTKSPLHWKDAEQDSPPVKTIKPVADVKIQTAESIETKQKDGGQQELKSKTLVAAAVPTPKPVFQENVIDRKDREQDHQNRSDGVSPLKSVEQKKVPEPPGLAIVSGEEKVAGKQESQGFWASIKQSLGLDENEDQQSGEETNAGHDKSTGPEKPATSTESAEIKITEEDEAELQQSSEPAAVAPVVETKEQESKQEESSDLWESIKKSFGLGKSDKPAAEEQSKEEQEPKQVESSEPVVTETVIEKKEPKPEDQKSEGFWSSIKKSFTMGDNEEAAGEQMKQEPPTVQVSKSVIEQQIKEEDIGPQTEKTVENSVAEAAELPKPEEKLLVKLEEKNRCYRCDFSGRDLSGMDLEEADLEGSDFSNANLTNVNLEGANLRATRFVQANLRNANMQESDLYKSNLAGADLTGANLKDALMDDADVSGVIGMQVESVLVDKK